MLKMIRSAWCRGRARGLLVAGAAMLALMVLILGGAPAGAGTMGLRQPRERAASPEAVDQAILKAQKYLFDSQAADGSWESPAPGRRGMAGMGSNGQVCGPTALATYALLASGVPPTEAHVSKALDFLRDTRTDGTYALGLRAEVWQQCQLYLEPKDYYKSDTGRDLMKLVAADCEALINGMGQQGDSAGMFTYQVKQHATYYDDSCSNYGAMGIFAGAQMGLDVPTGVWQAIEGGWKSHQLEDGGWTYHPQKGMANQATPTMTAGGLVNLFITQEYLDPNRGAEPHGNIHNNNIEMAIQWMGTRAFGGGGGGGMGMAQGYLMFNVERVGAESGLQTFKHVDWYKIGSDFYVSTQQADGSWNGSYGSVPETGYGLAFLALGRSPVVMNKLEYPATASGAAAPAGGGGASPFGGHSDSHASGGAAKPVDDGMGPWNERPRDVANIMHWIERQMHHRLNWQVVTLDMSLDVLRQSPILYISGNAELNFNDEQCEVMRQYVLEGGLILGNADGASKKFADSFQKLGTRMFPDYAFRPLPPDHPIYTDEMFPAKGKAAAVKILGLGNQAREFMLLFPDADPAKYWQQLPQTFVQSNRSIEPKEEMYQVAANIWYYCTEHALLRDKTKSWLVAPEPSAQAKQKIRVGRIQYDGNWNPEPYGWAQLKQAMLNEHHTAIELQGIRLGQDPVPDDIRIVYLTGTTRLELSADEKEALHRYAYEGGIILVDAAGGSKDFADSAEQMFKTMFDSDMKAMPLDHELFSTGSKITAVSYRQKTKHLLGEKFNQPVLKYLEVDGKIKVIFSPLDLSVGLVGEPVDAVNGYSPESAREILMNMILFAAKTQK